MLYPTCILVLQGLVEWMGNTCGTGGGAGMLLTNVANVSRAPGSRNDSGMKRLSSDEINDSRNVSDQSDTYGHCDAKANQSCPISQFSAQFLPKLWLFIAQIYIYVAFLDSCEAQLDCCRQCPTSMEIMPTVLALVVCHGFIMHMDDGTPILT